MFVSGGYVWLQINGKARRWVKSSYNCQQSADWSPHNCLARKVRSSWEPVSHGSHRSSSTNVSIAGLSLMPHHYWRRPRSGLRLKARLHLAFSHAICARWRRRGAFRRARTGFRRILGCIRFIENKKNNKRAVSRGRGSLLAQMRAARAMTSLWTPLMFVFCAGSGRMLD